MAKPSYIQQLDKGKLLTGKNFPEFVSTWNYAVNRIENLKGDRDVNPTNGVITVDNADPEHPVIRFSGSSSTTGKSGEFNIVTNIIWNTTDFTIDAIGRTFTFKDGLLNDVGEERVLSSIITTPWTEE